jgi:hypothetical protein
MVPGVPNFDTPPASQHRAAWGFPGPSAEPSAAGYTTGVDPRASAGAAAAQPIWKEESGETNGSSLGLLGYSRLEPKIKIIEQVCVSTTVVYL